MRRQVRRRRTEGGHGLRWAGVDGCLSPRMFTALLPMLILASALAPAGQEDVVAHTLITKFGRVTLPPL